MVTVIGPTPPGTGVMELTRYRASSLNCTSPLITDFPSYSTKLMPTSMTIESYFNQDDLMRPATPTADTTISAFSTVCFKSLSGV